ncbi:MAG: phenylacetic acid degradation b, partial [Sediminibacterium sp.]|nr:phenylacetic acid degradation b [Sediminibacterium sp.]
MIVKSIDPRINRASLDDERTDGVQQPMDQLETYEVFQQIKRGTHHQHVG